MPRVVDWMTAHPISVPEGTPLSRAARLMSKHGIRHLPVTGPRGSLVGLLTDYAVFGRGVLVGMDGDLWFPHHIEAMDARVDDVVEPVELIVRPDDDLASVLQQLVLAGQDACVAVDAHGVPVGILTEHDPVRYAAALLEADRPAAMDASRPVATVELADALVDAHREMLERGLRHLVVVDRVGRAEAVISYRDVISTEAHLEDGPTVADAVACFRLWSKRLAGTMTVDCAALMATHKIGCVPLLDDDRRPVAILTRADITDAVAFVLEEEDLFDIV